MLLLPALKSNCLILAVPIFVFAVSFGLMAIKSILLFVLEVGSSAFKVGLSASVVPPIK